MNGVDGKARLLVRLVIVALSAAAAAVRTAEADGLTLGVNRTNLMWRQDSAAILDDIKSAGIDNIRLSFAPPYDATIRTIREARERGLDVLLAIGTGQDAFRPAGTPRRPGGSGLFSAHRLSTLDPDRFRAVVGAFLDRLDHEGLALAAVEIGNENNWADFNGDLPIRAKGMGQLYETSSDISYDPEASGVIKGLQNYVAAVLILRELLDARPQRPTLVLGGLFTGSRTWTVASGGSALSHGLAMQFLRDGGALSAVDAVGVHLYPGSGKTIDEDISRFTAQIRDVTLECRIERPAAKPCWITEWGFAEGGDGCTVVDRDRLDKFRAFRRSITRLKSEVSIAAAYLYDWDDGRTFSVHRCGRTLPSAGFFKDAAE